MSATNFHSLLYEFYTTIARFPSDGCAFLHGQKNLPWWAGRYDCWKVLMMRDASSRMHMWRRYGNRTNEIGAAPMHLSHEECAVDCAIFSC